MPSSLLLLLVTVLPPHRPVSPTSTAGSSKSTATHINDYARTLPLHAADKHQLRKDRLHTELEHINLDPKALVNDPHFTQSPALRHYNSFLMPKSEGARAIADAPTRAKVTANQIAFFVREHRAAHAEWLRNHDRSLAEADALAGAAFPLTLVLDNVRSAHNVGQIIRACEAARVHELVLCGITPAPPERKVMKTALGASEYVRHSHAPSALAAVRELQARGVACWGVETTSLSTPLWRAPPLPRPLAFVLGNELIGVDVEVLEACDHLVSVPTYGVKNSLNVATCASVVVWEALRRWECEESDLE